MSKNNVIDSFIDKIISKQLSLSDFLLNAKLDPDDKKILANYVALYEKLKIKFPSLYTRLKYINLKNFEQSSSEATAKFKASMFFGKNAIDITGGLGIDALFFSANFENFIYCEKDTETYENFVNNFVAFNKNNLQAYNCDSLELLSKFNDNFFDLIYMDPSRRNDNRRFSELEKLEPNLLSCKELLLSKGKNILIKLSPLFHYRELVRIFQNELKDIYLLSVKGENKELLALISKHESEHISKTAVLLNSHGDIIFSITDNFSNIHNIRDFSNKIYDYLYEFDPAIRALDLQNKASEKFGIKSIDDHFRYFTADYPIQNFPGRIFKVLDYFQFKVSKLKQYLRDKKIYKAEFILRHCNIKRETLIRELKVKEGGDIFIIITFGKEAKLCFITKRLST